MDLTHSIHRSALAAVCLAIFATALAVSGRSIEQATAGARAPRVDATLLNITEPTRVFIMLRSNNLSTDAAARSAALAAASSRDSESARKRASANPYLLTDQERRAARRIERARTKALSAIRNAAEPDVLASETVASIIKHGGGEVHSAAPLPNTITATVGPRLLRALSASKLITSIVPASPEPQPMSSPIDGSETWHTNGFTGNGTSADNKGGPDYVPADAGVRTTHLAFRTRLPGDPANGPATGPTRITSPAGRTDFTGSEHGNTVAAIVATTDLTIDGLWRYPKGLAYGIDKVFDPHQAKSHWHWLTGITYQSEPGITDLPEAINYSAGVYNNTQDFDPIWSSYDGYVANLGITFSISGGNCGVAPSTYSGCLSIGDGIKRISAPGTNFNAITVGGFDTNGDPYNSNVWIPWPNSSPGPTWGGRKKPDLLSSPFGYTSGPNDQNDTTYENTGVGTSYAAPVASAGALLLASTGVYQPTAQKAILINSATPIQGQTYWTPTSGWGVIDLDAAFYQRGNYANGSITPQGENGVRFFRATGVTSGDRTTLVWNRRTVPPSSYRALTDLDLSQHNQATGATTATGGSDAGDSVDTNQTVSAANPLPGNGIDGGDNVEQVRSTSSGTQVLKVKALSSIDGLAAEPFSIASKNPLTPLETPVPDANIELDNDVVKPGETVTVYADITNTSSDIDLTNAQVTLDAPDGVAITGGAMQELGTVEAGDTAGVIWQVEGSAEGAKELTVNVEGVAYNETFTDAASINFYVDDTSPIVSVTGPGEWSATANPEFNWSAEEAGDLDGYDVSTSVGGAAPTLVSADTMSTSGSFTAPEGEKLTVLVTATDIAGNTSTAASASTTIDAVPPEIRIVEMTKSLGHAVARVDAHNVGSPLTVLGAFSTSLAAPLKPITGGTLEFTNSTAKPVEAFLRVTAKDALGRSADATSNIIVQSKLKPARLVLAKPRSKAGVTTIRGSLDRAVRGRVLITVRRIGKKGTKKRSVRAPIRRGTFSAKLRLAPGRYRIRVNSPQTSRLRGEVVTKRIFVR